MLQLNSHTGALSCDVSSVTVTPTVPDAKIPVTVNGDKPGSPVPLSPGQTRIEVEVTSLDGSNKQVGRSVFSYMLTGPKVIVYFPEATLCSLKVLT